MDCNEYKKCLGCWYAYASWTNTKLILKKLECMDNELESIKKELKKNDKDDSGKMVRDEIDETMFKSIGLEPIETPITSELSIVDTSMPPSNELITYELKKNILGKEKLKKVKKK